MNHTPVSHIDDLADRLRRVDLLLLRAISRQRARPSVHAKGQYWGQLISDDEVDELLHAHGEIDTLGDLGLDGIDTEIARSEAARDAPQPGSRIEALRTSFGLDGDDVDLILLALAPEIAAGYGKIFAYLHDDVHKDFLSVDLATRLIATTRRRRLALLDRLLPGASLITQRLLVLTPEAGKSNQAARRVMFPPRVLPWLIGEGLLPFDDGVTRLDTRRAPFIPESCAHRLEGLGTGGDAAITVAIVGGTDGAREAVAVATARAVDRHLVRVDLGRCRAYLDQPLDLVRDLRLDGAVPYVVNIPDLSEDPEIRGKLMHLGTALATLPYPVCVGGRDRRALATMLGGDRPRLDLPVGRVTVEDRAAAWDRAISARGWTDVDAMRLATRYAGVVGTGVDRVVERVAAELGNGAPQTDTFAAACRDAQRPEIAGLVQHMVPRFTWDDLVLAPKIVSQLKQLEDVLAQQETVLHGWGMQRMRPRGYGLKALFTGGPGTGKTMCAEVIAGSLGYDLYRVDLSSVVSKWVGETEKNLRQIFDAAEGGTSVLLFDEGDALFGSRGESKSAQDRYANQEVAYLLQRLEVYEGCAIVTTNLQENVDEAFLRRFNAVVEFPFPTPEERTRLWEHALPERPDLRGADLDTAGLGRQFHLAGGSIVNAAIMACVDAARSQEPVGMRHVVTAIARELHKMGKQVNRVSFGPWYDVVEGLLPG